jgi:hypothetical protein
VKCFHSRSTVQNPTRQPLLYRRRGVLLSLEEHVARLFEGAKAIDMWGILVDSHAVPMLDPVLS